MANINKITDQIHQLTIPIPYDLGSVNCYLIRGEKGYTIVDTGDHTEEAKAIWTHTLSDNIPVEKVVVTHVHSDHVGLAGWFQQQFNVPVWISKNSYEEWINIRSRFIGKKYESPLTSFQLLHGCPAISEQDDEFHRFETYQFEPTVLFEEHQQIKLGDFLYETIWTPGHSPDHFCFYDRVNQTLLVGDHILNSMNPIVISQQMGDNALQGYFESLDKMMKCKAMHILPGHGEPIVGLSARIEKMRSHYRNRLQQTYDAIQEKGSTAYQVSQIVYGTELPLERSMAAFMQVITNLIYLESIGHARMEEQQGIIYFYPI